MESDMPSVLAMLFPPPINLPTVLPPMRMMAPTVIAKAGEALNIPATILKKNFGGVDGRMKAAIVPITARATRMIPKQPEVRPTRLGFLRLFDIKFHLGFRPHATLLFMKAMGRIFSLLLTGSIGASLGPPLTAQSRGRITTNSDGRISPKDLRALKAMNAPPPDPPPQPDTRNQVPASGAPAQAPISSNPPPPPVAVSPSQAEEHFPALSDLEIQATIYAIAGLPDPFTEALLEIPPDQVAMEVCDSLMFIGPGHPIRVQYWIRKPEKTELSGDLSFPTGYGAIPIPEAYAGGVLEVRASRALVAYRFNLPDRLVFPNRQTLLRSAEVTGINGRRRIRVLTRPNIRMNLLPLDIQQATRHPQVGPAWRSFLEIATKEEKRK